ncbi:MULTISPECIES: MarR family winged helix-turn-helix transcriptional regulator [Massilia]|uniref:MarR family transcriptional regulator n=1 Tax=Massilia arenae TaxID=2603288 RepID=A0A5C7FXE3_9BURK|nr:MULTISPECIES: MarR family transcriptional regulator [Massilia]MDY0964396.1 MarR family transcriptional regulator [Massilia sp. CFBP9026]TXG00021.1 MarR family transcriptional regulator [Massilia arenae]
MSKQVKSPRFVFLLNQAQRRLQRWTETRPGTWEGISTAQVGLLFLLASRNQATVGDIAQALQVAPAATTNLSKRMEASGLIERIADHDDGRVTRLRLTQAGAEASAQSSEMLKELNLRISDGFSDEELAVVARWLSHVGNLAL